jgi:hypothetical protein
MLAPLHLPFAPLPHAILVCISGRRPPASGRSTTALLAARAPRGGTALGSAPRAAETAPPPLRAPRGGRAAALPARARRKLGRVPAAPRERPPHHYGPQPHPLAPGHARRRTLPIPCAVSRPCLRAARGPAAAAAAAAAAPPRRLRPPPIEGGGRAPRRPRRACPAAPTPLATRTTARTSRPRQPPARRRGRRPLPARPAAAPGRAAAAPSLPCPPIRGPSQPPPSEPHCTPVIPRTR